MADKPVIYVSFYDALRFANWMHNAEPTGAQSSSTTEDGAYDLSLGSSVARKNGAMIFLPSEDEWYKAAYYDATSSTYFDYPTGSDTQTSCTAPGAATGTANCDDAVGTVTDASAYTGSASPAGTFDQGGNVREWSEALSGSNRVSRGGSFTDPPSDLAASERGVSYPTNQYSDVGFRIATIDLTVPEPAAATLQAAALTLLMMLRRRAAHIAAA
jgi:formylglycine-generating enzyme required for sulfatase activity